MGLSQGLVLTNRLKKPVILGMAAAVLGGLVLALTLQSVRQTASPEPKFEGSVGTFPHFVCSSVVNFGVRNL
jgi:hypothetical protein